MQASLAVHVVALAVSAIARTEIGDPFVSLAIWADPVLLTLTLAVVLACPRYRTDPRERRFWDLIALAWICRLAVEFFFFFEPNIPFVSASFATDVVHILFYLCLALAVEGRPHLAQESQLSGARHRLESGAGMVAFFGILIYFALVVLPEPLGLSLSFVSRDRGLIPLLLVHLSLNLFVLGRLALAATNSRAHWLRVYVLLGLAVFLYAMANAVVLLQVLTVLSIVPSGWAYDGLLYLPGLLLIAAARCRPAISRPIRPADRFRTPRRVRTGFARPRWLSMP